MYELKICELVDMSSAETFLSAREMAYYNTLKIDKRRNEHALGRYALKTLLAENFVALPLEEIEVLRTDTGAPELFIQGQKSSLKISLSHSNGVAVAAAGEGIESLGVDVEIIENRSKKWAEQSFYFTEFSEGASDEFFTTLWAKKEAVLKMLGVGLSVNMHDLRFEKGKINIYGKLLERFGHLNKTDIEVKKYKNFIITTAYN